MMIYPRGDQPPRRFSWYKCHNCGAEYSIAAGVRSSRGCGNCYQGDIHLHSNQDGELPRTLPHPQLIPPRGPTA